MKELIYSRRSEMVKQRSLGHPLHQVVKDLHVKYDVSIRTLYYDWKHRAKWLPIILDLKDIKTTLLELLATHRELKRYALMEYLSGDNTSAKVGALRLIRDLNLDFNELIVTRDILLRVEKLENKKHG